MVRRGSRNNRRGRIGRRRVMRRGRSGFNNKLAFTGLEQGITPNPRCAQQNPWNSVVLQRIFTVANSTAFTITDGYFRDALLEQLNIPTTVSVINLRPMWIELYDLAGRPFQAKLIPYDAAGSAQTQANIISSISFPGRNTWSRMKLTWPKVVSTLPMEVGAGGSLVLVTGTVGTPMGITNITSTQFMVRIKVLWKTPTTDDPMLLRVSDFPSHLCKAVKVSNETLSVKSDSTAEHSSDS